MCYLPPGPKTVEIRKMISIVLLVLYQHNWKEVSIPVRNRNFIHSILAAEWLSKVTVCILKLFFTQCSIWNLLWIGSTGQNSFQTHSTGNTVSCLSRNLTHHKIKSQNKTEGVTRLFHFQRGVPNAFSVFWNPRAICLVQTSAFPKS